MLPKAIYGNYCLAEAQSTLQKVPPLHYLLVKLSTRCNISCTYCYWFRDPGVYEKPALLSKEVCEILPRRISEHVLKNKIKSFHVAFHGGEPLLFKKPQFESLCDNLLSSSKENNFEISFSIATNGVLIDDAWCDLLKKFSVAIAISIDGSKAIHDQYRIDKKGNGTFDRVLQGLRLLQRYDLDPGIISVCNPDSNPGEICSFFTNELGIKWFDILIPDATHFDNPRSIAKYYIELFDLWYDKLSAQGVEIRILKNMAGAVVGRKSKTESLGYGSISSATLLTDGTLEPLDTLKTAGRDHTLSNINILSNPLEAITTHPLWRTVREASLVLPKICQNCDYWFPCGGGHIASRWSKRGDYDSPSIYCADFKDIFSHVEKRVQHDIYFE